MQCAPKWIALIFLLTQQLSASPEPAVELPFKWRAGLIWVQVEGPRGGKPLNFILDSGVEYSVLDLASARSFNLGVGQPVTVHGMNTASSGYLTESWRAWVGGVFSMTNRLAMDLSALSADCHRQVDGLIGAELFAGRVVQIDFANERIRLLQNYKPVGKAEVLPLQIQAWKIRVPVEVVGLGKGLARLNTGCASSLRWSVTKSMLAAPGSSKPQVVIRRNTQSVRLGGLTLEDISTRLQSEASMAGEAGMLGTGLLSHFSFVTIDEPAGQLILEGLITPKPANR
jgi:hypothetical protein